MGPKGPEGYLRPVGGYARDVGITGVAFLRVEQKMGTRRHQTLKRAERIPF